eukprot:1926394-Rhodomonas_salina.3
MVRPGRRSELGGGQCVRRRRRTTPRQTPCPGKFRFQEPSAAATRWVSTDRCLEVDSAPETWKKTVNAR